MTRAYHRAITSRISLSLAGQAGRVANVLTWTWRNYGCRRRSTSRNEAGEVSSVYDISRPPGYRLPWPNEARNGRTGFDPRPNEDIFTPIYNDLRRHGALSWRNEPTSAAMLVLDDDSAGIGWEARPLPEPHTSPIPIQLPTDVLGSGSWPPELASPLLEPRSREPMSALARERAAVDGMLAALTLRLTTPAARPIVAGSARPGSTPYRPTTPPPIIPGARQPSGAPSQSPARGWQVVSAR